MKFQQATPFLVALAATNVAAWGDLGHETIAYVATDFVTSATETFFQKILKDTSANYLANVSTWADSYKYTTPGEYSKPYHFIDALDSPPTSCNVDYDRDCGSTGCVVAAIQNYTEVLTKTSSSAAAKDTAAMMIVHFVGDIHQPLHDENLDYGGNDVDVTFGGESTNLHAIWDTNMPEKYAGGYSLTDARTWATTLTKSIKSGTYESDAAGWLTGIELSDPVTSSMVWASDANAYVCSVVMPNGLAPLETGDLDTTYYKSCLPTIELQFAKAGYRLAAWLNLIATGETGL